MYSLSLYGLFIPARLIYTGGETGSGLQLSHLFCFLFIDAELFINMCD